MLFTACVWKQAGFRADKPFLSLINVREGRERIEPALWVKVIEADSREQAQSKAIELIQNGDPGDPVESIPIFSPKKKAKVA